MTEAVREMTFEEEYEILQKEGDRLFASEPNGVEIPLANCIVRRALRCINKLKKKYEHLEQKQVAKKPQTNADRIRAMSDKELAKMLSEDKCKHCINEYGARKCFKMWCKDGILEWLKKDVEDE